MKAYLSLAQVLVSIVLVIAILTQARGGGLGGIFGGGSTPYRTRRGVERTLFNLTIALAAIFIIVSIISVRVGS